MSISDYVEWLSCFFEWRIHGRPIGGTSWNLALEYRHFQAFLLESTGIIFNKNLQYTEACLQQFSWSWGLRGRGCPFLPDMLLQLMDITAGDYNLRTISQLFRNVWTFFAARNNRKITISCQRDSLVHIINEFFLLWYAHPQEDVKFRGAVTFLPKIWNRAGKYAENLP